MTVLFAIKSLTVPGGGAERVLVDLLNGFARRRYPVAVLTFDYPGPAFFPLSGDVPQHFMAFNAPGTPLKPGRFLGALPRMRQTLRDLRPALVVPFMHSTYVPLVLASAGLGLKFLVCEHTDARHYQKRPVQRWLRQCADRRALARVVPSRAALDSFGDAGTVHTHVIANPVDAAPFARGRALAPALPPVMLSVGRLMAEKDQLCLIRAFAVVSPAFPEWRLRILGEGPLRPQLEAEIARLGLGNRIAMPGSSTAMPDEYAHCAFLAVSSRYESFGMVAAEALASARPVLAFDTCAGVAEMVADGANGLLVDGTGSDEARVASLAAGMRALMADADLRRRMGAAAPPAIARFGLDAVLDAWEHVFEKVMRA